MVEKGFNSDIKIGESHFHIQTEDWGLNNPYFVSRVFKDGAVLKSLKTAYSEVLPSHLFKLPEAIRLAMKVQHEQILDLVLSGQVSHK